ncbi:protein ImuB [Hoeflea marina]|uniref:Protein ImuB n=2 Tax=Hoeflea marina TaxID=274592 RepID=A0A317PNG9_9HYPH|nr:protein ImuB [Hoeflea marina]
MRWGVSWRSRGRPEAPPIACSERVGSALRLLAVDEHARSQGVRPGHGVAEARAICPLLDVVPSDLAADQRFLDAVADWADRYTPLVGMDRPDGLFLDISGCAHLFGGERALLDDCLTRLFHLGVDARAAIAGTPGLAWALARHDSGHVVSDMGADDCGDIIPSLPVAALRLPPADVAALTRVGLSRIGDLIGAPRKPLARRFGPLLLVRLDQMTGIEEEPVSPRRPVAALTAERRLTEPVVSREAIEALTGQLADSLRPSLERRGAGARELELQLFRVDGAVVRIRVGAARPLRDPARLRGLFAERLAAVHDEIEAGFGFETVRLCVLVFEPLDAAQADFSGSAEADETLAALADRLTARLGADRVLMPQHHASHVPERASSLAPFVEGGTSGPGPAITHAAARPVRLFRHPEPVTAVAEVPEGPPVTFRWRRSHHRVTRAEGPERIAAEWWIDGEDAPARDYYRVEDDSGRRFWLFREGLYERDVATPRWFMHGLFG